jgi:transketolase
MTGFGASAPAGQLYQHFGITVEHVVQEAKLAVVAAC